MTSEIFSYNLSHNFYKVLLIDDNMSGSAAQTQGRVFFPFSAILPDFNSSMAHYSLHLIVGFNFQIFSLSLRMGASCKFMLNRISSDNELFNKTDAFNYAIISAFTNMYKFITWFADNFNGVGKFLDTEPNFRQQ